MARKTGQIIGRAPRTWMVRVYVGRDTETRKRKYLNKTIHGGLREAQAHLNRMLGERDLERNLDSSRQTLNQYLDRWIEVCAKPRLRAKSFKDYEGLLRRYVRPQLGMKPLVSVQAFDVQSLYCELLDRGLSARSIRYTHAVLRSALKQAVRWKLLLANPADSVDLPRHARRNVGVLSVEQSRRVSRDDVIGPSRQVNPGVHIILKYPPVVRQISGSRLQRLRGNQALRPHLGRDGAA
ncbi:MAG TPA: hypothetical protein VGY31_01550 [Terriglobia bacterium]|nr:hypothetical protein [Terriglobia bacterium]